MFHVKPIIELEKRKQERKIKIMGYPNFGKVKTIVFPKPSRQMTAKEYQELYGIDITEFFKYKITSNESSVTVDFLWSFRGISLFLEIYKNNRYRLVPVNKIDGLNDIWSISEGYWEGDHSVILRNSADVDDKITIEFSGNPETGTLNLKIS